MARRLPLLMAPISPSPGESRGLGPCRSPVPFAGRPGCGTGTLGQLAFPLSTEPLASRGRRNNGRGNPFPSNEAGKAAENRCACSPNPKQEKTRLANERAGSLSIGPERGGPETPNRMRDWEMPGALAYRLKLGTVAPTGATCMDRSSPMQSLRHFYKICLICSFAAWIGAPQRARSGRHEITERRPPRAWIGAGRSDRRSTDPRSVRHGSGSALFTRPRGIASRHVNRAHRQLPGAGIHGPQHAKDIVQLQRAPDAAAASRGRPGRQKSQSR